MKAVFSGTGKHGQLGTLWLEPAEIEPVIRVDFIECN